MLSGLTSAEAPAGLSVAAKAEKVAHIDGYYNRPERLCKQKIAWA
jgi:hypothetical protein